MQWERNAGGNQSFEVLKRGGLHLVITEVVPVSGGADKKQNKKASCVVQCLSGGLRSVWSSRLLVSL